MENAPLFYRMLDNRWKKYSKNFPVNKNIVFDTIREVIKLIENLNYNSIDIEFTPDGSFSLQCFYSNNKEIMLFIETFFYKDKEPQTASSLFKHNNEAVFKFIGSLPGLYDIIKNKTNF